MSTLQNLDERLVDFPEVRQQVELLLAILENKKGEFEIADHVEDILIKGNRKPGLLIMQEWAKKQEERSAQETKELKTVRNKGKKLHWRSTFGEINIKETVFKLNGSMFRPFSDKAKVHCFGYSQPLTKAR
jgi:hypothetical protein